MPPQNDLPARIKELVDERVALETKLQNETGELSDSRARQYDDQYAALQKKRLGLIDAEDTRFASTVAAMERELVREKHVMRYAGADDFGLPVTAFLICRFWLIDAWWSIGRRDEALVATAEQLYLHVNTPPGKASPMDAAVRARLADLQAAHRRGHAQDR